LGRDRCDVGCDDHWLLASRGAGGLSQLSVKVIKAGVAPLPIAVIAFGKPKRGGCGLADCAARCPQDPQPQQQT
jgi:hypothetical protein